MRMSDRVVCPTCGEKFEIPMDARPETVKEWEWIWNNLALPAIRQLKAECKYAEKMSHA